jgi:hypothetical protein
MYTFQAEVGGDQHLVIFRDSEDGTVVADTSGDFASGARSRNEPAMTYAPI